MASFFFYDALAPTLLLFYGVLLVFLQWFVKKSEL
jgi:hypothetical protein|tara:strand:- start:6226 stop:6330 length:105 start_codon:yes stop_codon:yes gene_type:complete